MAKKKTPPAKKQFIAIDTYADLVISKGSLEDVTQVLESYIQDEGYGEDDVEENIEVYELAEQKTVRAFPRGIEVTIES